MKNYLNLLKILKKNANSGYTLVELILASVLTLLVVSMAGYGVYVMTRENMIATASGDIKYNLGRAVDFISEEVKSSATITADSSLTSLLTTCLAAGTGNEVGTGATTPVLGLSVTTPSGQQNVIYYTQQPSSTWLGNRAIYRCGPGLDSNGAYTSSINSRLLIDLIASTKDSKDTATACANGGTAYPNLTSGFFVCKSGNLAELHIASSALESQTSKNSLASNANDATYGIISQAYTRASDGVAITLSGSNIGFTETAKATLASTSGTCSSVTIAGTAYTIPATTSSLSPTTNLSISTSPALTGSPVVISSNAVRLTNGTCTFSLTLRRT
jgi:hypothetical protein